MNVFVISLRTSLDRRENIARQLESHSVHYSLFDGIDVREDKRLYFHHYDNNAFIANTGRTANCGEIGCYASHLTLWRACLVLDEPIVVLEDDVELGGSFPAAMHAASRVIEKLGFIRLETGVKRPGFEADCHTGFSFNYCPRYPHGSRAYMISPAIAQTFIDNSAVLRVPLDKFIKDFWRHKQPLYALTPPVAHPGGIGSESTIRGRDHQRFSLKRKSLRWSRKRSDEIQRIWFNLRIHVGRLIAAYQGRPRLPVQRDARTPRGLQGPATTAANTRPHV